MSSVDTAPPRVAGEPRRRLATVALAFATVASIVWAVQPVWLQTSLDWIGGRPSAPPFDLGAAAEGSSDQVVLDHPAPEGLRTTAVDPGSDAPPGAALAGDLGWWGSEAFTAGQGLVGDPLWAWRPANPYRSLDIASPYVNVRDGARRTWSPPPCSCRRVHVWMFGGSTTFGLNQRDEHTIASELARVAFEHGIRLDVSNRGRNGHLHWIEAELFALDLLVDEPPDMAVFYDGWNDRWASGSRRWLVDGVAAPVDPTLIDLWDGSGRSDPPVPEGPAGASLPPPNVPDLDLVAHARAVHEQYDRSRSLSRRTAVQYGVLPRYVWQPSRYSRDLLPAEPHFDTATENSGRAEDQVMGDHLAEDVIDLTDALDGNREPLFTDDIHHNERGARLIAEALFAALRPDLERLAAAPGD